MEQRTGILLQAPKNLASAGKDVGATRHASTCFLCRSCRTAPFGPSRRPAPTPAEHRRGRRRWPGGASLWPGRRLRLGAIVVEVVKLRSRCVMTTYDPDTQAQDFSALRRVVMEPAGFWRRTVGLSKQRRVRAAPGHLDVRRERDRGAAWGTGSRGASAPPRRFQFEQGKHLTIQNGRL